MDLSDYNRQEIEQIGECKKELLEIFEEYNKLIYLAANVFNKIQTIKFSKRVKNPCTKCLVKAMCKFKKDVEQHGIHFLPIYLKKEEICHPKLKSLYISKIKKEIKSTNFINKNLYQFHLGTLHHFGSTNVEGHVYPYRWKIEE